MERIKKEETTVTVGSKSDGEDKEKILEESLKPKLIRFRKIGGGSLRFKRKIIKPNEIFMATLEEIPKPFLKFLVPLDPLPKDVPLQDVAIFTAKERAAIEENKEDGAARLFNGGDKISKKRRSERSRWYDVINEASGKVLNEKALTEKEADNLIQVLSSS